MSSASWRSLLPEGSTAGVAGRGGVGGLPCTVMVLWVGHGACGCWHHPHTRIRVAEVAERLEMQRFL